MLVDRIEITGRFYREGERAGLEQLANRYGIACARNTDQYDIGLEGWWDPVKGRHPGLHMLNPTRVQFTEDVLKRCKVSTNEQILEGGPGGGIFAEALAKRGYRVIGVDISEGAIRVAEEHAKQSGLNDLITYEHGSLYKLPLPNASLQAAVYPDVLEHLEDLDSAMQEISRVLVIGGVLVFDTISRNIPSVRRYMELEQLGIIPAGTHDPILFIRPHELKKVALRHGLEMARDPNNPYGVDIQSVAVSQGGDGGLSFELRKISRRSQVGHYIGYAIKS